MNTTEFMDRIDYEGGPYEAYEYGLRIGEGDKIDPRLVMAWNAFEDAMEEANYTAVILETLMGELEYAEL